MKQSWMFDGCVQLHLYKEDDADDLPGHWETFLPPIEQERAAKMASEKRAFTFRRTRALLRRELASILQKDPAALDIQCTPEGRPFLNQPGTDIDFSLSHSHGFILIGILKGKGAVGVDLQEQNTTTPIEKMARRLFSDEECRRIEALTDPAARRTEAFKSWCLYEAKFKLGKTTAAVESMSAILDNGYAYAVCYRQD